MTYIPPVNGGRINATIGGNTAGASTLVSTGTLTLAGGNNITLSQNGNAITISGAAAAAAGSNTLGMSNLGNTSGTSGVVSGSAVRYLFAGGNNVTLSQSINASTATVTISAANQTVQTQNLHNLTLSGNTAGVMAQVSSGTLTLAGGNNITLSQNGNAITISGGAGGGGLGAIANSQTTYTSGTVNLLEGGGALTIASTTGQKLNFSVPQTSSIAGAGIITLSSNGSTISISATQSVQTQNLHNITLSGNTTGTLAQISSGTLTLAGGNNITLSQNGNAVTISAGAGGGGGGVAIANSQATYTSGTVNMLEGGGAITIATSAGGQSLKVSVPATSSLSATGALSISTNASTISIGAPAFSAGISNIGNTAGTSGTASNQVVFAGGNNITLSQSTAAGGNTITISGGAGGGTNTLGMSNIGNTSGTTGVVTGSAVQLAFAGGNNITLSQSINASSGTITISAASQSVQTQSRFNLTISGNTTGTGANVSSGSLTLAGGNNVTLSQNGNAITISAGTVAAPTFTTLSRYEYLEGLFTSLNTVGQGSLSINHMYIPHYVSGSAMKIGGSISGITNTSATTASVDMSLWMGLYTLNGSTLSLASSGSANNGFQWSQTNSSTGNTSINSMRQMTVPMNVFITPGEYWVAAVLSSNTTYTSAAFTLYGNNQVANGAVGAVLTPIGSNTTAARDVMLLQGIYTANTSAGPTSIAGSQINNTSASNVQRANFYNVIFNATY